MTVCVGVYVVQERIAILEDLQDKMLMLMYNQLYNTYSSLECVTTGKYNQHLINVKRTKHANSHSQLCSCVPPSVPRTAAAFPPCTAMELRCRRCC